MVVFVSVLFCCIYGLLSEQQDERREGPRPRDERRARLRTPDYDVVYILLSGTPEGRRTGTCTPTPDADVVLTRVDCRWSLDADERYGTLSETSQGEQGQLRRQSQIDARSTVWRRSMLQFTLTVVLECATGTRC
ncbi:hypothetical protein MTO96_042271 [Rhipicephalus appendiculatus]